VIIDTCSLLHICICLCVQDTIQINQFMLNSISQQKATFIFAFCNDADGRVLCNFSTCQSNSTVLHPTRLQWLILMFGGILAVKICRLFEYREIIIRAVCKVTGCWNFSIHSHGRTMFLVESQRTNFLI
jgi:hypothetical protein